MEEDILKKVVISCTSHKGLTPYTMRSVQSCPHVGVSLTIGIAEVALARNLQIRDALKMALAQNRDVILLLDDDIVFRPDDVRTVAMFALRTKTMVSGVYAVGDFEKGDVRIAAAPLKKFDHWAVGLGFVAVPVSLLVAQLAEFPLVSWKDEEFRLATWSGPGPHAPGAEGAPPENITWISEDYRLCMRLGGALLLPEVRVGHAKLVPFYPPLDELSSEQAERELEILGPDSLAFLAEKLGTTVDQLKVDYCAPGTLRARTAQVIQNLNPAEQKILAHRTGRSLEQLRRDYGITEGGT